MNRTEVKAYLLEKPEVVLDHPFGPEAEVYKVKHKMFALVSHHFDHDIVNLKCEPEEALALRDIFAGVIPGYHMNKKHWNTVFLAKAPSPHHVPAAEIQRMIDRSYTLVVKSLPKAERQALELSYGEDALYR